MNDLTNELQLAAWHVAQAKTIIADQAGVVESLRQAGRPTSLAQETLEIMTNLLELFEADERELQLEVAQKSHGELRRETLEK